MFLTPPSPSRTKFFSKLPHERSPPPPPPHPLSNSHESRVSAAAPRTNYLPALQPSAHPEMTSHHRGLERGLPPPPGSALVESIRPTPQGRAQPEYESSRTVLPPPTPSSRHMQYERPSAEYRERPEYRQQYQQQPDTRPASADQLRLEEYRLHQEEERTRQEELRHRQEELRYRQEEIKLNQRRLEQEMLGSAMRYQTHPNLVPLIFVGLGSANSAGFETAQQYINTIQQIQQHFSNQMPQGTFSSPDLRRDYRTAATGPLQYGALGSQASVQSGSASAPGTGVYPSPAYQTPQSGHLRQTPAAQASYSSASRAPQPAPAPKGSSSSALPRLSTNEAQVSSGSNVATATAHGPGPAVQSDRPQESPLIHFHHWTPPATQGTAGREPGSRTSPKHHSNLSQASESAPSPRKRKNTGPHQPAPAPSSAPRAASPTFSTTSTSSKRPGRRRESEESPAKREESRATSQEPRSVQKEDSKGSRSGSQGPPSQPPTQPSSSEMSTKPATRPEA